ncbi:MAG: hypothetical protein KAJ51_04165, partial [Thermoplasmata archaeon]|nr:hypothetical protein [Thermoplasmata archaeon]
MHLHSYRKYQSESQVPESVTQLGIATGVDISYTHVPRAVKRLQEQGLIIELMAHVDNQPTSRRRKAYFLTERGLKIASELQSSLADLSVVYKDENGNTSKVLLKDINELLNSNEDLFTLFRCLDSDSMFDITRWNKKKKLISIQSHEKFGAAPKVENQNIRLNLKEAKELMGSAFNSAEAEAIYYHTEG